MGLSPNAGPPAQPPAAPSFASASSYAPPQQQPPQKQYSYTTASEMITAADIEQKLNPKIKYAYDSDEDTEGGTWEHKKRAAEMKKTAQRAKELTEMAHRKHHMADYLPKEELEKLYEKVGKGSPRAALCAPPVLRCTLGASREVASRACP